MKRVIALLMENQPGALSRVVGLFSQRGYNIETLIVAPTSDSTLSRLTMSTEGDEKVVEQITKQLNKLIDVVTVVDLSDSDHIEREFMLIKFNEDNLIEELQKYVDSTYDQHYSKNKFQATEFIIDAGHGEGFCIGNIMKYAQRYGKKDGYNRKDLQKVLHYALIALSVHDSNQS